MSAWLWLAALAALLVAAFVFVLTSPIDLEVYAAYPAQAPLQIDVVWLHGLLDLELQLGGGDEEPEPEPETEPGTEAETGRQEPPSTAAEAPEPEPEPETEPEAEPTAEPDRDDLHPDLEPRPQPSGDTSHLETALDTGVEYLEARSRWRRKVDIALAVLRTKDLALAVTRMLRDLVRAVHVDRIGLQTGFGFGSPAETGKVYGQLKAAFAWTHATEKIHVDINPDFHAMGFEAGGDVQVHARTWNLLRPLIEFALAPPTLQAVKNGWRAAKDD